MSKSLLPTTTLLAIFTMKIRINVTFAVPVFRHFNRRRRSNKRLEKGTPCGWMGIIIRGPSVMHWLSFGSSSFYTTTCYWGDEDGIRYNVAIVVQQTELRMVKHILIIREGVSETSQWTQSLEQERLTQKRAREAAEGDTYQSGTVLFFQII